MAIFNGNLKLPEGDRFLVGSPWSLPSQVYNRPRLFLWSLGPRDHGVKCRSLKRGPRFMFRANHPPHGLIPDLDTTLDTTFQIHRPRIELDFVSGSGCWMDFLWVVQNHGSFPAPKMWRDCCFFTLPFGLGGVAPANFYGAWAAGKTW